MNLGEFCCFKNKPEASAAASTAINGNLHKSVNYQPSILHPYLALPVLSGQLALQPAVTS